MSAAHLTQNPATERIEQAVVGREQAATMKIRRGGRELELHAENLELKRQLAALSCLESQFRLAWDNSNDGMRLTDSEGRMLLVNEAFCRMVGKPREELLGKPFSIIHGEGDTAPASRQARRRADARGMELRVEKEMVLWDGRKIWFEISNTLLEQPDLPPLLLSTFRDVTERKSSEEALRASLTEQKKIEVQLLRAQRMESIGTLAGGIAHDLNNILAPITIAAQVLRMRPLDEETDQLLTRIETSAQRGADVVRQVLTFARGMEGERAMLQPRHLVKDIAKIAKETFPRSITVTWRTGEDLWPVMADATQLHQVLLNLCLNARDAMPSGGHLQLTADNVLLEDTAGLTQPVKAGPYVLLQVKDNGVGIAPAIINQIFEPFFTTKEAGCGTGLGLSTVLSIVKSHGGFVNVHSEEGHGSIFKVHLPATPNAHAFGAKHEAASLPVGHGELILVVDDEAGIRDVACKILVKHGYAVLTATDGVEGVALFAQEQGKVQLVLTDIMMPRMEGLALIRAVRKLDPNIKVIATSGLTNTPGHSDRAQELQALNVGDFLAKPFTAEKMLVSIQQVLAAGTGQAR